MLSKKIVLNEDLQREIDYLPVGEAQVQRIRTKIERDLENCVIDKKMAAAWWRQMVDYQKDHWNPTVTDQRTYSTEAERLKNAKEHYAKEPGSSHNWLVGKCEYMQIMHPFSVAPFCVPASFIGSDGVVWVNHAAEFSNKTEVRKRQPFSTVDKKSQSTSLKRYLMLTRMLEQTQMMECEQGVQFCFVDSLPESSNHLQVMCRFQVPQSYDDNDLIGGTDTVQAFLDVPREHVENLRKHVQETPRYHQISYLHTV